MLILLKNVLALRQSIEVETFQISKVDVFMK